MQSTEQQPTASWSCLSYFGSRAAYLTLIPLLREPNWLQNLEGPNSSTSPRDVCPAQAIPELANSGEEEGAWNKEP